ncbi:MAG: ABC transporter permease [Acidimicrobiia bacterium]|nr:ABC transporter permease [Acidimicrobiia bacterium]MBV9284477.1 ABC transporter permease [Acidimicrobiia bacterium]
MPTTKTKPDPDVLDVELAGLDALDVPIAPAPSKARRIWAVAWPKLAAVGIFFLLWQSVVWVHWKPSYILPGPVPVLKELWHGVQSGALPKAAANTMQRAAIGYGIALLIGSTVGMAVARSKVLRTAIGSMITGLQTMPTIAWFPLAIVLFGLKESAILFVVILGAAPAIANGIITGVDHIPPVLLRAGRVLGARGLSTYRHVIIPACLPGYVAGLKQGWAFAWRSLLAGELLVIIAKKPSLGVRLELMHQQADYVAMVATMVTIFVIGVVVDSLFFARFERAIRGRWGLVDHAT